MADRYNVTELNVAISGDSSKLQKELKTTIKDLENFKKNADSFAADLFQAKNLINYKKHVRELAREMDKYEKTRAFRSNMKAKIRESNPVSEYHGKALFLPHNPHKPIDFSTHKVSRTGGINRRQEVYKEEAELIAEQTKKEQKAKENAELEAERSRIKQEKQRREELKKTKEKAEELKKKTSTIKDVVAKGGKSAFALMGKDIVTATKRLQVFKNKFKGIALYRTVRALLAMITKGFQEGIKNLYEYSRVMGTDFKKNMDSITSSALLVKNSVAAMAAPIINLVTPAIYALSDAFSYAANSVGLFIARITDQKSFSWAIRSMKEYQKAARQLLGFDEINKLNGNDDNYAGMFKEVSTEITPQIDPSGVLQNLKQAIKDANFEDVGRYMAQVINEVFEAIDFAGIGQRLGQKVDNILKLTKGFFEKLDGVSIGESVANFFNGIFERVDFADVGTILASKATFVLDTIYGFFKNLDWKKVGTAIKDTIVGFFNKISTWLKDVNWTDVGESLYTNLKAMIESLDFKALASTFWTLLKAAIKATFNGIGGIINAASKAAATDSAVLEYLGEDEYEEYLKLKSNVSSKSYAGTGYKLQARADGGFVDRGQLFIANEAGPELVGTVGGKTAVTNQDQFVAAVANAMIPVVDAIYSTGSATTNAISNMPVPSVRIGDKDIFNASQRGSRLVGGSLIRGV